MTSRKSRDERAFERELELVMQLSKNDCSLNEPNADTSRNEFSPEKHDVNIKEESEATEDTTNTGMNSLLIISNF